MRIQHNIMAMNAYRNYTNNVTAMKSNLEKLSSGYKINRAGDDAAGLAISEKMRAQISGLEQAQKNAKSGINLVQTAEGALTEVHDMLNRMVTLAEQSANGTYDSTVDRAQLQKEMEQLREEIDRIADSSNFNGIKLLDGSMDAETRVSASEGEFSIQSGTTSTAEGVLPEVGPTNGTNTILHSAASAAVKDTTLGIELHDTAYEGQEGDTLTISIGSDSFTAELKTGVTKVTAEDIAKALAGTDTSKLDVKDSAGAAYDAANVSIGGAKFTAAVSNTGKGVTFTQNANDTASLTSVDFAVNITAAAGAGPAAPTLSGLNSTTITTATNPGSAGTEAVYTIDLTGVTATKAGDVEITAFGKTYTITVNANDDDSTIASALLAKIQADLPSADATGGAYTAALASGNKGITLTAANKATITTDLAPAGNSVAITNKKMDDVIKNAPASGANVTFTDGASGSSEATLVFDLADLDLQTAQGTGQLTFSIGSNNFTVDVAANEDADAILGKLKTAIGSTTIATDGTGGAFTLDSTHTTGKEIKFKAANQGNLADASAVNSLSLTVSNTSLSGNTGKTVAATTPGADTIPAGATTATIDLTGAALDKAGDIKFTIGGKDYTITVAEEDKADASRMAAALVAKLNADKISDATTGLWSAAVDAADNKKVVLSTANTGTPATALSSFTATAQATPVGGTSAGLTGTWNVKTTDQQIKKAAGSEQLATTHFSLTKEMASAGASIRIGDDTYKFTDDAKDTDAKSIYVGDLDLTSAADLAKAAERLTDKAVGNATYTVGQQGAVINVTERVGYTTGSQKYDLSTEEGIEKSLGFTKVKISQGTGKELTLQIGDTADDYNQLKVSIGDAHCSALGIDSISIAEQDKASSAVKVIKEAINYVSDIRGTLGATQNRLDHTINNLSVMTENIQDAESTIRDTDVAEEMMAYTKNNILIQSAQAMLAQANQVPQGVLQLLQ